MKKLVVVLWLAAGIAALGGGTANAGALNPPPPVHCPSGTVPILMSDGYNLFRVCV